MLFGRKTPVVREPVFKLSARDLAKSPYELGVIFWEKAVKDRLLQERSVAVVQRQEDETRDSVFYRLSNELALPELGDLADIVRLGGEEGAQIYNQLRAKSGSLRAAMLNAELARANEASEKLSIPMSILGMVFLAILITPALLRVVG